MGSCNIYGAKCTSASPSYGRFSQRLLFDVDLVIDESEEGAVGFLPFLRRHVDFGLL